MKNTPKKYSIVTKNDIIAELKTGRTAKELSEEYKINYDTIKTWQYKYAPKNKVEFEELKRCKAKLNHAKIIKSFNSLNIGVNLIVHHKSELNRVKNRDTYTNINIHDGVLVGKTDNLLTVQDKLRPYIRQSYNLADLISKNIILEVAV